MKEDTKKTIKNIAYWIFLVSICVFIFISSYKIGDMLAPKDNEVINMSNEFEIKEIIEDVKTLGTELRKKELFYQILCKWVKMHQTKESIPVFLKEEGYYNVAIYGYKELGQLLYSELKEGGINVTSIIDKNTDIVGIKEIIISPDDFSNDETDMILVTAVSSFESIEKELKKKINIPIISLETLILNKEAIE